MAASKQQGSYLAVFWTAITVLCAGLAYYAEGFGKLVLLIGFGRCSHQLDRIHQDQTDGRKDGSSGDDYELEAFGHRGRLGWLVHYCSRPALTTSLAGRLIFALVGITVSLVGIIGILPMAFGRSLAGKAQPSSLVGAKTTMEHSR